MKIHKLHRWDVTAKEAITIQQQLREQVIRKDQLNKVKYIAGVDVGFEENGNITRAAIAVLEFPSLTLKETSIARLPTSFPYVPGLLSFRELPAVLEALKQLKQMPDLFLCDGQGIAHPRRLGIASHLGLLSDVPSIGVGKSKLIGTHQPVKNERGSWRSLMDKDEVIGAVLRTRKGIKPIYVSIGHKICLQTAIDCVMNCTTRFKLPETTRMAHKYASAKS